MYLTFCAFDVYFGDKLLQKNKEARGRNSYQGGNHILQTLWHSYQRWIRSTIS